MIYSRRGCLFILHTRMGINTRGSLKWGLLSWGSLKWGSLKWGSTKVTYQDRYADGEIEEKLQIS